MDLITRAVAPDWYGEACIVAGAGPSLTPEVVRKCRMARWIDGWRVLVVNDAYKAMPWADALYAADFDWWVTHEGAKDFSGQRWTSHSLSFEVCDNKVNFAAALGTDVRLVRAQAGKEMSIHSSHIAYGEPPHSGFQALNLALLHGIKRVVLVGFDYRVEEKKTHFFGDHPYGLRTTTGEEYASLTKAFDGLVSPIPIVNATPGSALRAFKQVSLDEALHRDDRVHRDGAESHTRAG